MAEKKPKRLDNEKLISELLALVKKITEREIFCGLNVHAAELAGYSEKATKAYTKGQKRLAARKSHLLAELGKRLEKG